MELFESLFDPQLAVVVLTFVGTLAVIIAVSFPVLSGDRFHERMNYVASERERLRAQRLAEMMANENRRSLRKAPKGYMQQVVDALNLQQVFDADSLKKKLKMAGLRGQAPFVTFVFFKITLPIVFFLFALFYFFIMGATSHSPSMKFLFALIAGGVGFFMPSILLQNIIQKRQQAIARVFPDALDLLLICVQSGMSIEAAFAKVAEEISSNSLELAEELSLTTAELSYLQNRKQAFENLGMRTGIPQVKAVATSLIQAERYGTPVSQALRVLAQESREERMALAEKKAAALPPKLTVPMILFFLPVIFVVILGPSAIRLGGL